MPVKFSEVKAGDILIADNGFSCLDAGDHVVQAGEDGSLFIPCDHGKHWLAGQEDNDGNLVGLEKRQ